MRYVGSVQLINDLLSLIRRARPGPVESRRGDSTLNSANALTFSISSMVLDSCSLPQNVRRLSWLPVNSSQYSTETGEGQWHSDSRWLSPCRSPDHVLRCPFQKSMWRGARVVESTCLESMRPSNGTVGSNPTLSAKTRYGKSKKLKDGSFRPAHLLLLTLDTGLGPVQQNPVNPARSGRKQR